MTLKLVKGDGVLLDEGVIPAPRHPSEGWGLGRRRIWPEVPACAGMTSNERV